MVSRIRHRSVFILSESSQDQTGIVHGKVLLDELLQQSGHLGAQIHENADEATRFCQVKRFG